MESEYIKSIAELRFDTIIFPLYLGLVNMVESVCDLWETLKTDMIMVLVQIAYAAVNVLYKLAINDGMSMRVATAYRLIFASAFTVPVALFFDRKKRPKITWRVLLLALVCGLCGASLFLNLYAEGLALMSATFMMATINLVPGITFVMALSFGLEKLNWGLAEGRAKVIGTIVGISGAMMIAFFKGIEINIWSSQMNLMHPHKDQNGHVALHHGFRHKLLGVSCAIASCCIYSLWFIVQAKMIAEYPSPHSSAALMTTMGAIQATVFALCVEKDWNQWKLGYNIRLLTVAYAGIVTSGIVSVVIAWCIKKRGPIFASAFNPLQLLLVAIAAYLMLDEKLYLGSALGAVLIVCGLYAVLWGKAQDLRKKSQLMPLENTQELENVEVVVTSTPVDHNKSVQSIQSQTPANENAVTINHCYLSKT
ncbi:WAT1-related protein At1g68170-like [Abrus precatorius]|uniref:WAT1-related protein At1g68170-like n=1 Tax=Abrus precatorius TaxID=3816 RepID=A0A8B8KWR6_ABRPR|nr:WAT1-related protein At1g68170-like [Abrus precatorius]